MSSKSWGYKILSDKSFNFYHPRLAKIEIKEVARQIDSFREISILPNGSINIYTEKDWLEHSVENVVNFAQRIDN